MHSEFSVSLHWHIPFRIMKHLFQKPIKGCVIYLYKVISEVSVSFRMLNILIQGDFRSLSSLTFIYFFQDYVASVSKSSFRDLNTLIQGVYRRFSILRLLYFFQDNVTFVSTVYFRILKKLIQGTFRSLSLLTV